MKLLKPILKQQETTSLAERIRLLTCDVEDEPDDQHTSPVGANSDKMSSSSDKSSDKSFNSIDKNSEKAFGSASSSSSSSTISAPVPARQHPPDLGDAHQEPHKVIFYYTAFTYVGNFPISSAKCNHQT